MSNIELDLQVISPIPFTTLLPMATGATVVAALVPGRLNRRCSWQQEVKEVANA